jgi:uncharacterized protein
MTRNYGPIDDFTVFELYPDVQVNRDNIEYYRGLAERRLLINRCGDCGTWIYPHRPLCPECWSWDIKAEEVSGLGSVFMWTTLMQQRNPLSPMEPMPVAAVDFAEQKGLRYLSRIVNCAPEDIYHDMPVRLTWIEIGSGNLEWPAFEPIPGSGAGGAR